jgi:Contractile injection system tube protein
MPSGFRNQPKVLRGAFVEYGISVPPLIVLFQFNPLELSRHRSQVFSVPASAQARGQEVTLREFHQGFADLTQLRDAQQVSVQPESLSFDIRLDATDRLDDGDRLTEQFGIAPQLATLEFMMQPKSETLFGEMLAALDPEGFSFTCMEKPPMVLFIWGRRRVLPVNIDTMSITETEFSADLQPLRATVNVDLTVIEGRNAAYTYTKILKELMVGRHLDRLGETKGGRAVTAALHRANLPLPRIPNIKIPDFDFPTINVPEI